MSDRAGPAADQPRMGVRARQGDLRAPLGRLVESPLAVKWGEHTHSPGPTVPEKLIDEPLARSAIE